MSITRYLRAVRLRDTLRSVLVTPVILATILVVVIAPARTASAAFACQSVGYDCVIDGYNATTMNNNWATKYYGPGTAGGIGNPPHNCTLYAAWMLANNGFPDPGRTWGYAGQWGQTLAAATDAKPAIGSIAWFRGGGVGHVAYVAQVNWTNNTVLLVADNYNGGRGGYTSNGWTAFSQVSGFIHLRDVIDVRLPQAPHPATSRSKFGAVSLRFN
jgi:surface antigen